MSLMDRTNINKTTVTVGAAHAPQTEQANTTQPKTMPTKGLVQAKTQLKPTLAPTLTARPTLQVRPMQTVPHTQQGQDKQTLAVKASIQPQVQAKPQLQVKPSLSIRTPVTDEPTVQAAPVSGLAKAIQASPAHTVTKRHVAPLGQGLVQPAPQQEESAIYESTGAELDQASKELAEQFTEPTPELAHDRRQRLITQTKVEELTTLMKDLQLVLKVQVEQLDDLTNQLQIQGTNLASVTQELEALKKDEPLA